MKKKFLSIRAASPARIVAGAFVAMFCAGLLLRTPWLAQTICWAVLLPGAIWLAVETQGQSIGRRPLFWLIVGGLACYFAALLASTMAAGFSGNQSVWKHLWTVFLFLLPVAAVGQAGRYDPGFALHLGRFMSAASAVAAVVLLGFAYANGMLGLTRFEGDPAINWILNSNAVGGVYAISFAVAAGHGLRRDISIIERSATFAVAVLLLAVVLLTQSRGAMLGCAGVIIVLIVALPLRVAMAVCGLVAVTAALIAIGSPEWIALVLQRGDGLRPALWKHYLELSQERLWLGHGLNFDPEFVLKGTTIYTPHNILVSALVRGGIPGLLSLTAALIGATLAAVSAARRNWWLPSTVLASAFALSSVDHELVPSTFSYYWFLFTLPLSLAAVAASIGRGEPPRSTASDPVA